MSATPLESANFYEVSSSIFDEINILSLTYGTIFEDLNALLPDDDIPSKLKDVLELRLQSVGHELDSCAEPDQEYPMIRSMFEWLRSMTSKLVFSIKKSNSNEPLKAMNVEAFMERIRVVRAGDRTSIIRIINRYVMASIEACQTLCSPYRDETVKKMRAEALNIERACEKEQCPLDAQMELIRVLILNIHRFQVDLLTFTSKIFLPTFKTEWPKYYRAQFNGIVEKLNEFDMDCYGGVRFWLRLAIKVIRELNADGDKRMESVRRSVERNPDKRIRDIVFCGYLEFMNPMSEYTQKIFGKEGIVAAPTTLEVEYDRFIKNSFIVQRVMICQAAFAIYDSISANQVNQEIMNELYAISEPFPTDSSYSDLLDHITEHLHKRLPAIESGPYTLKKLLGLDQGESCPKFGLPSKYILSIKWIRARVLLKELMEKLSNGETNPMFSYHEKLKEIFLDNKIAQLVPALFQLLQMNYTAFSDIYATEIHLIIAEDD